MQRPRTWVPGPESRAFLAVLAHERQRALVELRSLEPGERAACARAAQQLAELCEDPAAAVPYPTSRAIS